MFASVSAHSQSDSIVVEKRMGEVYYYQGKRVNPNKMLEVMNANPEAYALMKKAQTNYSVGNVFGFAGGFCLGYGLVSLITGDDTDWTLLGVGAGLIGISIPFSVAYSKNAKEAVRLYNSGLIKSPPPKRVELSFELAYNLIGLKLRF